jgi:hypothetical protein
VNHLGSVFAEDTAVAVHVYVFGHVLLGDVPFRGRPASKRDHTQRMHPLDRPSPPQRATPQPPPLRSAGPAADKPQWLQHAGTPFHEPAHFHRAVACSPNASPDAPKNFVLFLEQRTVVVAGELALWVPLNANGSSSSKHRLQEVHELAHNRPPSTVFFVVVTQCKKLAPRQLSTWGRIMGL